MLKVRQHHDLHHADDLVAQTGNQYVTTGGTSGLHRTPVRLVVVGVLRLGGEAPRLHQCGRRGDLVTLNWSRRHHSSSDWCAFMRSPIMLTTFGSVKVVTSPRARCSATSRSSRRMIFPERVLGRSGVNTI